MKHLFFICFAVAALASCTAPAVEETPAVETPVVVEPAPVVVDTTAVEVPTASEEAPAVEAPAAK